MRQRSRKKSRPSQKVPPKSRPDNSSSEITIEIELLSSKLARTVYESILPETEQPSGFRSHVSVRKTGKTIVLHIVADDIVALRAAANTFLRFVAVAVKTVNVVAPFYRNEDDA